jgi:hypothetical protein
MDSVICNSGKQCCCGLRFSADDAQNGELGGLDWASWILAVCKRELDWDRVQRAQEIDPRPCMQTTATMQQLLPADQ